MRRSRCSPTPASGGGGAVPAGHNACGEGTPRALRCRDVLTAVGGPVVLTAVGGAVVREFADPGPTTVEHPLAWRDRAPYTPGRRHGTPFLRARAAGCSRGCPGGVCMTSVASAMDARPLLSVLMPVYNEV